MVHVGEGKKERRVKRIVERLEGENEAGEMLWNRWARVKGRGQVDQR